MYYQNVKELRTKFSLCLGSVDFDCVTLTKTWLHAVCLFKTYISSSGWKINQELVSSKDIFSKFIETCEGYINTFNHTHLIICGGLIWRRLLFILRTNLYSNIPTEKSNLKP